MILIQCYTIYTPAHCHRVSSVLRHRFDLDVLYHPSGHRHGRPRQPEVSPDCHSEQRSVSMDNNRSTKPNVCPGNSCHMSSGPSQDLRTDAAYLPLHHDTLWSPQLHCMGALCQQSDIQANRMHEQIDVVQTLSRKLNWQRLRQGDGIHHPVLHLQDKCLLLIRAGADTDSR